MKLTITKEHGQFVVDNKAAPGSPPVGYGRTMTEAMGEWLRNNQEGLGIEFELDAAVQGTEIRRIKRELAKR